MSSVDDKAVVRVKLEQALAGLKACYDARTETAAERMVSRVETLLMEALIACNEERKPPLDDADCLLILRELFAAKNKVDISVVNDLWAGVSVDLAIAAMRRVAAPKIEVTEKMVETALSTYHGILPDKDPQHHDWHAFMRRALEAALKGTP